VVAGRVSEQDLIGLDLTVLDLAKEEGEAFFQLQQFLQLF
jgi:hypothetical protein